jgi:hypothetical protein
MVDARLLHEAQALGLEIDIDETQESLAARVAAAIAARTEKEDAMSETAIQETQESQDDAERRPIKTVIPAWRDDVEDGRPEPDVTREALIDQERRLLHGQEEPPQEPVRMKGWIIERRQRVLMPEDASSQEIRQAITARRDVAGAIIIEDELEVVPTVVSIERIDDVPVAEPPAEDEIPAAGQSYASLRRNDQQTAQCEACGKDLQHGTQIVLANVYVDGVWSEIQRFHRDCYDSAGWPYGKPKGHVIPGAARKKIAVSPFSGKAMNRTAATPAKGKHVCEKCGKTFQNASGLGGHKRTHGGAR